MEVNLTLYFKFVDDILRLILQHSLRTCTRNFEKILENIVNFQQDPLRSLNQSQSPMHTKTNMLCGIPVFLVLTQHLICKRIPKIQIIQHTFALNFEKFYNVGLSMTQTQSDWSQKVLVCVMSKEGGQKMSISQSKVM